LIGKRLRERTILDYRLVVLGLDLYADKHDKRGGRRHVDAYLGRHKVERRKADDLGTNVPNANVLQDLWVVKRNLSGHCGIMPARELMPEPSVSTAYLAWHQERPLDW
jgi:hypothetical protein